MAASKASFARSSGNACCLSMSSLSWRLGKERDCGAELRVIAGAAVHDGANKANLFVHETEGRHAWTVGEDAEDDDGAAGADAEDCLGKRVGVAADRLDDDVRLGLLRPGAQILRAGLEDVGGTEGFGHLLLVGIARGGGDLGAGAAEEEEREQADRAGADDERA